MKSIILALSMIFLMAGCAHHGHKGCSKKKKACHKESCHVKKKCKKESCAVKKASCDHSKHGHAHKKEDQKAKKTK